MIANDLRVAQERQRIWSEAQFPDRNPNHAIMGLIEELGELCEAAEPVDGTPLEYLLVFSMQRFLGRLAHINLKRNQGIRKASTTLEREQDAVNQLARAFWEYHVTATGYVPNPNVEAEPPAYDEEKAKDAVGDVAIYLLDFCTRSGYLFDEILGDTLAEVLKRDWASAPSDGVVPSNA